MRFELGPDGPALPRVGFVRAPERLHDVLVDAFDAHRARPIGVRREREAPGRADLLVGALGQRDVFAVQRREELDVPRVVNVGRDGGGEPAGRERVLRVDDPVGVHERPRHQAAHEKRRARRVRLQHPLGHAPPVGPRADVGVHVEEDVQVVRQRADHPSAERVVVGAPVGPVRDLDQEVGRRARVGLGAAQALDEGHVLDGADRIGRHGPATLPRSGAGVDCDRPVRTIVPKAPPPSRRTGEERGPSERTVAVNDACDEPRARAPSRSRRRGRRRSGRRSA